MFMFSTIHRISCFLNHKNETFYCTYQMGGPFLAGKLFLAHDKYKKLKLLGLREFPRPGAQMKEIGYTSAFVHCVG